MRVDLLVCGRVLQAQSKPGTLSPSPSRDDYVQLPLAKKSKPFRQVC